MKKRFCLDVLKYAGIALLLLSPWAVILGQKVYHAKCQQDLSRKFWDSYISVMTRPEYADKTYWEFYNKELASINAGFIQKIEAGQWDLELAQLRPLCLICCKRAHYQFILMEVPALRENDVLRAKIVEQIVLGDKENPNRSCEHSSEGAQ
jgi:hypothetical protein